MRIFTRMFLIFTTTFASSLYAEEAARTPVEQTLVFKDERMEPRLSQRLIPVIPDGTRHLRWGFSTGRT